MVNGDVFVLISEIVYVVGKIYVVSVYIDGSGIGDIGNIVFCDCCIFFEEGFVIVVVFIDMKNFCVMVGFDIILCGFIYMCEFGNFIGEV